MIRILLLLVLTSSCVSQKVVFDKNKLKPLESSYKKNQNFFLWGAFQTRQSSPLYICDGVENIYSIETKKDFKDVFLNTVTGGIVQLHAYTPRQSLIYCNQD